MSNRRLIQTIVNMALEWAYLKARVRLFFAELIYGEVDTLDVHLGGPPQTLETRHGTFEIVKVKRVRKRPRKSEPEDVMNGWLVTSYPDPPTEGSTSLKALGGFLKGEEPRNAFFTLERVVKLVAELQASRDAG